LLRLRMDAKHRTREAPLLAVLLDDARVEDAVEAVEITVWAPRQRIGQLVGIGSAEAGDDQLGLADRWPVTIHEGIEKKVGRVGNPDAAVADRDARRNVE